MTLAYAAALPQRLLVGASDSKDGTSFQQQSRAMMSLPLPIAQGKPQGAFLSTCSMGSVLSLPLPMPVVTSCR